MNEQLFRPESGSDELGEELGKSVTLRGTEMFTNFLRFNLSNSQKMVIKQKAAHASKVSF